jgi:hypothetical protein
MMVYCSQVQFERLTYLSHLGGDNPPELVAEDGDDNHGEFVPNDDDDDDDDDDRGVSGDPIIETILHAKVSVDDIQIATNTEAIELVYSKYYEEEELAGDDLVSGMCLR